MFCTIRHFAEIKLRFLFLLALAGFMFLPLPASAAQERRSRQRKPASSTSLPPSVSLAANTINLTLCAEDTSRANTSVQLTANPTGYSNRDNLRYLWSVTGGRIIGTGPSPTWDLAGVEPGAYTASVEVDNELDGGLGCRAFSSALVVASVCAPKVVQCPQVNITSPETVEAGTPLTFSANLSGGDINVTPVFNWTVTGGQITSGQGTSAITVDTTNLGGGTITANVQIGGYDPSCSATATGTGTVNAPPQPRRFDEFPSISFDDDKARLDNLAVELQNDPTARAFIVVHPGRRSRPEQAARLGTRARSYLAMVRGIDANRIVVVSGGARERDTLELYIVPLGAQPPSVGP